jgi:hypothetical protein
MLTRSIVDLLALVVVPYQPLLLLPAFMAMVMQAVPAESTAVIEPESANRRTHNDTDFVHNESTQITMNSALIINEGIVILGSWTANQDCLP